MPTYIRLPLFCKAGVSSSLNCQTMKEQIEKLEAQLKELRQVYENEQKTKYEAQPHKHFEKGDIVTDGNYIALVEWTENNGIGMPYEKGYMGASIINGNRGFGTFKRDDFEIVSDPYYKDTHEITISLTGLEIEEVKYSLGSRNCNPNKSKTKMLDLLDTVHKGCC